MKITVKNFGPIREAKDIEISPMMLFVGPSNTGKSYLAILLYAVVKVLVGSNLARRVGIEMRTSKSFFDEALLKKDENFEDVINKIKDERSKDVINKIFAVWAQSVGELWRNEISYCFGEEGERLIKLQDMSVVIKASDGSVSINLMSPEKSSINLKSKFLKSLINKKELEKELEKENYKDFPVGFLLYEFIEHVNRKLLKVVLPDMIRDFHYLPAIRGGIMQSHRALVDATMEQAPMVGLARSPMRRMGSFEMFTGVLSDFMRKLINLDSSRYRMRFLRRNEPSSAPNISKIGKLLESDIMEGEIIAKKNETGYPDYRYKNKKMEYDLLLKNTSSMVSELAPVSIFIRYHLKDKDLFIVEEPEAHLHPQGQREIADVLVRLANAGVFVLATTHSDIVLEQIGNAVHASQLKEINPKAKIKLLGKNVDNGALLEEKKAAVYSFAKQDKEGKTVVKRIKFKGAAGFVPDDHLKISQDIYNETVRLFNSK